MERPLAVGCRGASEQILNTMSIATRIRNASENALIKIMHRNNRWWRPGRQAISFTFDDFPTSAFEVGGRLLGRHDLRATYYVSMGLLGCRREGIEYFTLDTLEKALAGGHELGCHTFDHEPPWSATTTAYFDSIDRNLTALHTYAPSIRLSSFSYPLGAVTVPVKAGCGRRFTSCRSIFPGINGGLIDLNLLRAIPLYDRGMPLREVEALIALNVTRAGWLVFYTHDVSSHPSRYGCTPEYFEAVLQYALDSHATILPVGEIAAWLG